MEFEECAKTAGFQLAGHILFDIDCIKWKIIMQGE